MWQCQIEQCGKQSNSPDNLAKHLAKTHKDKITIKLSRQKVKCPLCNIEYSNAIALLMHLEMTSANMTWKPMKCEILTANIIPPENNNINNKWQLIQEHNTPRITPEQQQNTTQPYIQQLQEYYEKQTMQKQQIQEWIPPEPKPQEKKQKQPKQKSKKRKRRKSTPRENRKKQHSKSKRKRKKTTSPGNTK